MRKLYRWAKREILHVFPAFVFFFISFNIINVTEVALFKKAGITPFTELDIFLAAAVIAKILIVIDHLRMVDLFSRRPLIFKVLWKTFFYWMITMGVRFCIRLMPFLFKQESFSIEFKTFLQGVDWHLFFAIQIWYLMLFFIFVTARELTLKIGYAKMRQIFFGS